MCVTKSCKKLKKFLKGNVSPAIAGIAGTQVGKINIFDQHAYVAVHRDAAKAALKKLTEGKLKGRSFRVRRIQGQ